MMGRRYVIRGRVQGVGYRYWTVQTALGLGVRGYVRNLPNGDVEVHAEAAPPVLDTFRAELAHGPTMARVSEVMEHDVAITGQYSTFHVRG